MSYKLKTIVVFLRVLSDFIILRNFGKNIYIYIYIYIYIIRQYAQKNDNAFLFTRHVSAWYSNHHQLKLLG